MLISEMKKSYKITIGISILIIGILLLGTDRLFVSAAGGDYANSVTIVTTIAILFILVAVIWLFKSTLS